MVVTKNQIRPRRKKFHFSNAEILMLDTVGFVQLVGPAPLGTALSISGLQIRSNIDVAYTGDDPAAFILFSDDFCATSFPFENDMGVSSAFTDIFTVTGLNLWEGLEPRGVVDSSDEITYDNVVNWTDLAQLAAIGGIFLQFSNGGTDLGGGGAANFLDVFISYDIVNLTQNQ